MFWITASGPIIAVVGITFGFKLVFWVGILVCGFNLFMNLASGVMKLPLLPSMLMLTGILFFPPWYFGAALGLAAWTAFEALGEIKTMFGGP